MGSRLAGAVLGFALLVGAWALFVTGESVADPLEPGDAAPAFELPRLPGATEPTAPSLPPGATESTASSLPPGATESTASSLPPGAAQAATLSLKALRGRVVLLNFWATWCKPCEDEMPAMQRLHRELAPRGFELVAISVDARSEDVLAFRERLGLSFPILHDPDRRVADAYQAYRFPESWLIDAQGRLVGRFIGPREWDAASYVERVERLLEGAGAG